MDHEWAAQRLEDFQENIEDYYSLYFWDLSDYEPSSQAIEEHDRLIEEYGSQQKALDRLISLNPVMRGLINAAQAGLGDYVEPPAGWRYDGAYWQEVVKPCLLRAKGIHRFGEEARRRMRPDSPDLAADQFHPWVWEAAAPLWHAGSRQEAVLAAARSVNARMQQKRGHHDKSEAALCREFFSLAEPLPGRPRLRFHGYAATDPTRRSKQQGALEFGAGCFEGIRNPAAHKHELTLSEQVALEQLAAFSLLARWVDECEVETASDQPPTTGTLSQVPPGDQGAQQAASAG